MTDDFFQQMRADWGGQQIEVEALRRRLERRVARARVGRAAELALMGAGMVAGALILVRAVPAGDLISILGGTTLLLSMPATLLLVAQARRGWPVLEDRSPEGVLTYAISHLEATRRMNHMGRWSAYVLTGLVAVCWACVAAGLAPPSRFLLVASAAWLGASVVTWIGIDWAQARTARELRACEQLLEQYRSADASRG